uniref:Uncharacterized protein n=1 Tax=Glossina palpalis gambiensis TaxID=67801 RepID=A0A1B0AP11_9MUSC
MEPAKGIVIGFRVVVELISLVGSVLMCKCFTLNVSGVPLFSLGSPLLTTGSRLGIIGTIFGLWGSSSPLPYVLTFEMRSSSGSGGSGGWASVSISCRNVNRCRLRCVVTIDKSVCCGPYIGGCSSGCI